MPATVKSETVKKRVARKPKPATPTWVQLPSFDMSQKPCVPVGVIGERLPRRLSIRDVIMLSTTLASVVCTSPSVFLGVMRTLICLVQCLATPKNAAEWRDLFKNGVDEAKASAYFDRAARNGWFDLFHHEHPFFQVQPRLLSDGTSDMSLCRDASRKAIRQNVAKLTLVKTCGSMKAHFEKSFDADPLTLSSADVGLELMGYQACGMGGSNGGYFDGCHKDTFVAFASGPGSAGSGNTSFILIGESLSKTLALNTLTSDFAKEIVSESADRPDYPAWEDPPSGRAVREELTAGWRGPLDFLTLTTKRISLLAKIKADGQPELDADGHALISGCLNRQGRGAKSGDVEAAPVVNPWCAYVKTKKGKLRAVSRWLRGDYDPPESPWVTTLRGLAAFKRPLAIEQAAKIGYEGDTLRLRLLGVYHDPKVSKIDFVENEEVALPAKLLDRDLADRLLDLLKKSAWGVVETIKRITLEVDFGCNKYKEQGDRDRELRRHDTAAKLLAMKDVHVSMFWDAVHDHAMHGASAGLLDDEEWLDGLKKIAFQVKSQYARSRDLSVDTIMGVARAIS